MALLLTTALAGPAQAASVFINGVQVDGLANQKFDRVNVSFDDKGNVHIDAPGVSVQTSTLPQATTGTAPKADPVKPPDIVTKHYFLVTEQPAPGMAAYDIDVYINSKWIRRIKNGEDQIVMDVTKYLLPGANKVMMAAKKLPERKSTQAAHFVRIIIGEGAASGDQVMIDNPIVSFKRSAADTDDTSDEFALTAR
jgi:predicted secreted protein